MRSSALGASSILRQTLTLIGVITIAALSCAQQNSIAAQKTSSGLSRDEALAELRARGVEFNVPSFLRSVDQENPALVNLFLVAGVDANSNEIGGITALMIAAGLHRTDGCIDGIIRPCYSIAKKTHKSDLDIVRLLIKGGAVVQTRDGDGETALHKTAAGGNVNIAKILIANGADVNSRNAHGTTPMMLAALTNEGTSMAELLFANGATITEQRDSLLVRIAECGCGRTSRHSTFSDLQRCRRKIKEQCWHNGINGGGFWWTWGNNRLSLGPGSGTRYTGCAWQLCPDVCRIQRQSQLHRIAAEAKCK
jgi:hypothetical protein